MDPISLGVILGIIVVGIWLKWFWLAGIGVFLLIAILLTSKPKKKAPAGGKVKVRPIIVKRKYDAESIYPKKMTVYASDFSPPDWWEAALNAFGKFLGRLISGGKKD